MNGKKLMKHHYLHITVIIYADYMHIKRVCKDFEIKN